MSLLIRDVEVEGRSGLDVRIRGGRIVEIAPDLRRSDPELNGGGGALIPGLADHHIHLLALAANADSVALDQVSSRAEMTALIRDAMALRPAGTWLRVVGYHERLAGDLGRDELDALAPGHRVRVQHQTGSLWMLNSLALQALDGDVPHELERDASGRPTGRLWRGDAWLRDRLAAPPPPLAPVGVMLARYGVVMVTDASVTTDRSAADLLAQAARRGDLPQHLTIMSGGKLEAPDDDAFTVGPVKILLDDHALPDFDAFAARVRQARVWRRAVAVHCVTAGELALTLSVLSNTGARPGDRIEHGGVIPRTAIAPIRDLGLAVVTQPGFIFERGDRYLAEVDHQDLPDLYRCASLIAAGVPVAASSDAPYTLADPWRAMQAAIDRRSRAGQVIAMDERLSPLAALNLYLGAADAPGHAPRRVAVGAQADLCLLGSPLAAALQDPARANVRATLVAGDIIYEAA